MGNTISKAATKVYYVIRQNLAGRVVGYLTGDINSAFESTTEVEKAARYHSITEIVGVLLRRDKASALYCDYDIVRVTETETPGEPTVTADLSQRTPGDYLVVAGSPSWSPSVEYLGHPPALGHNDLCAAARFQTEDAALKARREYENATGPRGYTFVGIRRAIPSPKVTRTETVVA